ncbi:hypothetical protein PS870_00920 [Pseudomonas fluorescens]|uniref:RHS repeat-associated core domain-containing protein n=1 Tax=Pseudomonas fluorescens TaxID=294 RepID=A0A5E7HHC5_PSEFL|nr:RHS repeat-associated core domain-containing protein [Pseudomonas fluorescens]VVO63554.1 hypothetical protein PS870_00920 [Pseudomonas fluorescens]
MEDELEERAADYLSSVLGFNGERIDPVLGGYHLGNGYRLYSPSLRRFASPDSMSPFGKGGINPYAYCEGDPINNTDPTGRSRVFGAFVFFENVGELALGAGIDNPELIAALARRDEEHLAARSAREVASRATRASSFSAETEHAAGRREAQRSIQTSYSDLATETDTSVFDLSALSLDPMSSFIGDPDNFTHFIKSANTIYSTSREGSFFFNTYEPEKWTFMSNERGENTPYYASDITKYQYNVISRKNNFFGTMPKLIERENVTNQATLENTENLGPEDLFNVFFSNTPNGKSTQRILDAFGLKATKVTRIKNNFLIEVE